MHRVLARLVVLGTVAWGSLALAAPPPGRAIYLNGIKIDPNTILKNQAFPSCEVRFDENGDVWITAKGFNVAVKDGPPAAPAAPTAPAATPLPVAPAPVAPAAPPPAALTKHYFLITQQTKKGIVQYDVDVYVNGALVKKVRSADDATVLDVTSFVKPGENRVKLVATKAIGDQRLSTSADDSLDVIIGEGELSGKTVTITRPVVQSRRNAMETANFNDEPTFVSR